VEAILVGEEHQQGRGRFGNVEWKRFLLVKNTNKGGVASGMSSGSDSCW